MLSLRIATGRIGESALVDRKSRGNGQVASVYRHAPDAKDNDRGLRGQGPVMLPQ
jgi:hypothetical protein